MNLSFHALLLVTTLLATACSQSAESDDEHLPMLPQSPGQTFVFECQSNAGAFSFTIRTGPGEIALWLPQRFERPYLVLGQVRSASGAKYEGDGVTVWNKGPDALLEVDGETIRGCAENRYESTWEHAKLSGVDFRGIGNEPGWILEIRDGDSIRFTYDYGQNEAKVSTPEPEVDTANRSARYVTESLEVLIQGVSCNDTMADYSFESRVTVKVDDREFHGCGRALH